MTRIITFLLIFSGLTAFTQEPVDFHEKFRRGIYLSFDEFRANRPSVTDTFEITGGDTVTSRLYVIRGGSRSQVKNYWGFSDGKDVYIHHEGNFRITRHGRYSLFEGKAEDETDTAGLSSVFILSMKDGSVERATEKTILRMLSDDPALYKDFRRNGSRDLIYQYTDRYNRRHQVVYPLISEVDLVAGRKVKGRIFPNAVYIEAFGNSVYLASVNYERLSFRAGNFRLYTHLGLGYARWEGKNLISAPVGVSGIFQIRDVLGIEAGAGTSIIYSIWNQPYSTGSGTWRNDSFDPLLTGFLGIRYQHPDGLMFRVGFIPIFDFKTDEPVMNMKFTPWFGFSIGYSFKD